MAEQIGVRDQPTPSSSAFVAFFLAFVAFFLRIVAFLLRVAALGGVRGVHGLLRASDIRWRLRGPVFHVSAAPLQNPRPRAATATVRNVNDVWYATNICLIFDTELNPTQCVVRTENDGKQC